MVHSSKDAKVQRTLELARKLLEAVEQAISSEEKGDRGLGLRSLLFKEDKKMTKPKKQPNENLEKLS